MSTKKTYDVSGTTCGSCEILIERELKELPGVLRVSASHDARMLELEFEDGTEPNVKAINKAISSHGYRATERGDAPLSLTSRGWKHVGGSAVLVLAAYLLLDAIGITSVQPSTSTPGGLLAVFGLGLVAAVSSCTAVIAGLAAGLSSTVSASASAAERIRPHLWFNAGRLVSFVVFGAVIGWLGSIVALAPTGNAVFVLLVAVTMMVMGLSLLDVMPSWARIRPPKALASRIHAMGGSSNPAVPGVLGAATFFLPCGFTQAMQLYALSLGDAWSAGLVMAVFALGTMPALIGVGMATAFTKGKALRHVTRTAGAFVMVMGMSTFGNAAALLGIDIAPAKNDLSAASVAVLTGGEQVVTMEVTREFTYSPDVISVREGVPVRWDVFGSDWMGCADTLVLRQFGVNARLKPGFNEVRFTPDAPGTYTFSCSMGMIRGTLVVTPAAT